MARKGRGVEAADAVRGAVDRTFQATVGQASITRERAQELVDELASAAGRVRSVLDEVMVQGPADELRALREQVAALERRVSALERKAPASKARKAPATKPPKAPVTKPPRKRTQKRS